MSEKKDIKRGAREVEACQIECSALASSSAPDQKRSQPKPPPRLKAFVNAQTACAKGLLSEAGVFRFQQQQQQRSVMSFVTSRLIAARRCRAGGAVVVAAVVRVVWSEGREFESEAEHCLTILDKLFTPQLAVNEAKGNNLVFISHTGDGKCHITCHWDQSSKLMLIFPWFSSSPPH